MRMGLDHCIHGAFHVFCFSMLHDYVRCDCVIGMPSLRYIEKY